MPQDTECSFRQTDLAHTCSCGRTFTRAEWEQLPFVGRQTIPAGADGPAQRIELRNCPCGSTRSVEAPPVDNGPATRGSSPPAESDHSHAVAGPASKGTDAATTRRIAAEALADARCAVRHSRASAVLLNRAVFGGGR